MASRTLTDIALELGFSSPAHFSTLFREAFEMTPSEYRRNFLGAATPRRAGMPLHDLAQAA
jgi:AraC-like DNA-binding protein